MVIVLMLVHQFLTCQAASYLPVLVSKSNGSQLCAVGNVSYTIQTDDIIGVPYVAPGATKCAFFCTGLTKMINCTGFNYLTSGLCQFFSDLCLTLYSKQGCMYFQDGSLNQSSPCKKPTTVVIMDRPSTTSRWNQTWASYKNGFTLADGGYWLGLEQVYKLTSSANYRLLFELFINGVWSTVQYKSFVIGDEVNTKYTLSISGYSGSAGDQLSWQNGMKFSTWDRDNDIASYSCAYNYGCGWWFKACWWSCFTCNSPIGPTWQDGPVVGTAARMTIVLNP